MLAAIVEKGWQPSPIRGDFISYIDDKLTRIENGYWNFIDRHSVGSKPFLQRGSFNFTFAILDTDNNILYVYELDT